MATLNDRQSRCAPCANSSTHSQADGVHFKLQGLSTIQLPEIVSSFTPAVKLAITLTSSAATSRPAYACTSASDAAVHTSPSQSGASMVPHPLTLSPQPSAPKKIQVAAAATQASQPEHLGHSVGMLPLPHPCHRRRPQSRWLALANCYPATRTKNSSPMLLTAWKTALQSATQPCTTT